MNKELQDIINRIQSRRVSRPEPVYECQECKDTGFQIITRDDGTQFARECKCRKIKRQRERMLKSGIIESNIKTFDKFETFNDTDLIKVKNKAKQYCENFDKEKSSVLLTGASGRGKTTLGFAIVDKLMVDSPVLYMPYREIITKLKQGIMDKSYEVMMNEYKQAYILFIDDLFKGRITESDINIIYEIVNYRYTSNKPMIVSTERTIEQLIEIDEAIGGRIIEMSKKYLIVFDDTILNCRLRRTK